MVGLTVFFAFCTGALVSYMIFSNDISPLASVKGALPRWEIETLAFDVAQSIATLSIPGREPILAMAILKEIHVECFLQKDPLNKVRSWGVYRKGRLVRILAGEGWQRRLCMALAHAIRTKAMGDADNAMTDRMWFVAALKPLRRYEDKS